jgi:DNA invertase Pin-like site-specific DNA recombinase
MLFQMLGAFAEFERSMIRITGSKNAEGGQRPPCEVP